MAMIDQIKGLVLGGVASVGSDIATSAVKVLQKQLDDKFEALWRVLDGKHETILEQLDRIEENLPKPAQANYDTVRDMFVALSEGEKIPAIKALRTLTGLSLREAKDFIEIIYDRIERVE